MDDRSLDMSISRPAIAGARADGDQRLKVLETTLITIKRRKGRLLRGLGERALDIITEGGSLAPEDPKTQILVKDIQKTQREIFLLEDRVRSLKEQGPRNEDSLPPVPGTDSHFPFSR